MGRGARVERVRRLGGGIAQATHALSIVDASGAAREVVLQQWTRPGWEVEDPGFGPAKEAAVLGALAGGPVPVPDVIAVDADGDETGSPALLMGRLPGRPPTVAQVLRRETVATLAETLVALHRLAVERWAPELVAIVPAYYAFGDLASTVIPANRRRPDLWAEAVRIASQPPPRTPSILIHRDFHARNTLWLGSRLTGVVDWSSASFGPPAADLAHLRVDLQSDFSVEAAIEARRAYVAAGGDLTDARFHQLRTVFDSMTDDAPDSTDDAAVNRLEQFLEIVLAEPDGPALV